MRKKDTKTLQTFLLAWVVKIAVVFIFALLFSVFYYFLSKEHKLPVADSNYKAVFLDSGEVYFGKIKDRDNSYILLEDVYYFKGLKDQQAQLMPLNKESYSPFKKIMINNSHVLYIQDLRPESKIIEAIKEGNK